MSNPTFQVTSTTHESEDDDCVIVSDVKHRLVNRPEQSLDDEVDAGLSAFGILIGNLTTPQAQATVKTEPTDDDDSTSRDQSFEQDREVAAKKNVCSHNRHGDEIDHAVSIPLEYNHSSVSTQFVHDFCPHKGGPILIVSAVFQKCHIIPTL